MSDKISVIVPIFNASSNVSDCISSILNQTYEDIEVLLINDGSTDTSMKICYRYANKDNRVKVINETNKGRGEARNLGIKHSSGSYILFVDADDCIGPNHIQKLYSSIIKYHSDISCEMYYRVDHDGTYYFVVDRNDPSQMKYEKSYTPFQWTLLRNTKQILQIFDCPWSKLYRASLFKNIEYPKNKYVDDTFTTWRLYLAAHKISFLNVDDYCYRINSQSITESDNYLKQINRYQSILLSDEEKLSLYNILGFSNDIVTKSYNSSLLQLLTLCRSAMNTQKKSLNFACFRRAILNKYQVKN